MQTNRPDGGKLLPTVTTIAILTRCVRGHVAQDILPYVCIYEHCPTPQEMYLTSEELLQHMRNHHSLLQWACDPCASKSGSNQRFCFESFKAWADHMKTTHKSSYPESDLESLAKLSRRKMLQPVSCPLCGYAVNEPRTTLDEHIARHLHDFSLRSLPWNAFGKEVNSVSQRSDNDSELSGISSMQDPSQSHGIIDQDVAQETLLTLSSLSLPIKREISQDLYHLCNESLLHHKEFSAQFEQKVEELSAQRSDRVPLSGEAVSPDAVTLVPRQKSGKLWSYDPAKRSSTVASSMEFALMGFELSKLHMQKALCIVRQLKHRLDVHQGIYVRQDPWDAEASYLEEVEVMLRGEIGELRNAESLFKQASIRRYIDLSQRSGEEDTDTRNQDSIENKELPNSVGMGSKSPCKCTIMPSPVISLPLQIYELLFQVLILNSPEWNGRLILSSKVCPNTATYSYPVYLEPEKQSLWLSPFINLKSDRSRAFRLPGYGQKVKPPCSRHAAVF